LFNFYNQATYVLTANSVLSKTPTPKAKIRVLQQAAEKGVRTDLGHRSVLNFAEAVRKLPQLQSEFRQRFQPWFTGNVLDRLEKSEEELVPVWSLWHQFALHADQLWSKATPDPYIALRNSLATLRSAMVREFRPLRSAGVRVRILSETVLWDQRPALWLAIDVETPVALHEAFQRTVAALRAAMGTVAPDSLLWYALSFWWPTLVFVPLVTGKSLAPEAWKVDTVTFISGAAFGDRDWWNYVLHTVPPTTWSQFRLAVWEDPRLAIAKQLQTHLGVLWALLTRFADFELMPPFEEPGQLVMQDFIDRLGRDLSAAAQGVADRITELTAYINTLSAEELQQRLGLMAVAEGLTQVGLDLLAPVHDQGELRLDLTGAKEWLGRVQAALARVDALRLCWAADVLGLPVSWSQSTRPG